MRAGTYSPPDAPHHRLWFDTTGPGAIRDDRIAQRIGWDFTLYDEGLAWRDRTVSPVVYKYPGPTGSTYALADYRRRPYCQRIGACRAATHDGAEYDLTNLAWLAPQVSGSVPAEERAWCVPPAAAGAVPSTPVPADAGWELSDTAWQRAADLLDFGSRAERGFHLSVDAYWSTGGSVGFTVPADRMFDAAVAADSTFECRCPAGCCHDVLILAEVWMFYRRTASGGGAVGIHGVKFRAYAFVYAPLEACGA